MPICWNEEGEMKLLGPKIVKAIVKQIKVIRDKLKVAQDR